MPYLITEVHQRHNRIQWIKGICYGLASVLLWWLSYWIFLILIYIVGICCHAEPEAHVARTIALACTALLAIAGYRYGKGVFELEAYDRSVWDRMLFGTSGEDDSYGPPSQSLDATLAVSKTLFAAPRMTVNAIRALRNLVWLAGATVEPADRVFRDLLKRNEWVRADSYGEDAAALPTLARMGAIWHHVKHGVIEVRVARDLAEKYGVLLQGAEA